MDCARYKKRMFPTHVGMNRDVGTVNGLHINVPHTRGDEPDENGRRVITEKMFPTHVGMNQTRSAR